MGASAIRWTNQTWNPVTGCSRVSPGCAHCYAEALSLQRGWSLKAWTQQNAAENVVLHPERLRQPFTWKGRQRVFVNSMSDLFHPLVPDDYLDAVFAVMLANPQHTFQLLTKRPERMPRYLHGVLQRVGRDVLPAHIWLGTSVEDQRRADDRIQHLLATDCVVKFLSCEPLLGPVDLRPYLYGLQWVIVGGESGPHYRPMEMAWARDLRDQCVAEAVAFYFKQDSARITETRKYLVEEDGSQRVYEQYPDTRERQLAPI